MKKHFLMVGMVAFGILVIAYGKAEAGVATFFFEPDSQPANFTWSGGARPYARNIFFDFSTSPILTPKDQEYFGRLDSLPANTAYFLANDAVSFPSETAYNGSGATGKIGVGNNKTGTALFKIVPLSGASGDHLNFYLESEVQLAGSGAFINWALQKNGTGSFVAPNYISTFTNASKNYVRAYWDIGAWTTYNTLQVTLHGGTGSGSAFIDNLHIATTPEPVSTALFLTGGALLAARRRMQKKSGLAIA